MGDDQVREIVPFWPHERYASTCATGEFAGYRPRAIGLDDFLSKSLPGLQRDQRLVVIFPGLDMKGAVIGPETLKADLEAECEQYE